MISVSGNKIFSSGLPGYNALMWYVDIYTGKTHIKGILKEIKLSKEIKCQGKGVHTFNLNIWEAEAGRFL